MKILDPHFALLEKLELRSIGICFAEEGEGGEADGGGVAVMADPGQAEGEAPAIASRPEYVPEKFWDPESGKIREEQIFKSYGELERNFRSRDEEMRGKISGELEQERLSSRPESPTDYEVDLPNDYIEMGITIADNDPLVGFWREQAHEFGLSPKQFNEALTHYVDASIKSQPDPQAEMAKLGDTGKVRAAAIGRWASRTFQAGELNAVQAIATTADGVTALEKLMEMSQNSSGPPDALTGTITSEQVSQEELASMMDDPRYIDPMRRDPSYVKRVEAGFEKLYGHKPA